MNTLFQKHQALFLSAILVWLIAPWFSPSPTSPSFLEIDFWLMWGVAMLLMALPFIFLEVALAKRSKKMPMTALPELTRQADVATYWRISGWMGVVVLALFCASFISLSAQHFSTAAPILENAANSWLWVGILCITSIALSFISIYILPITLLLALAAVFISGINPVAHWQITGFSLNEWKQAVSLALVATGLGTGLYWQSNLSKEKQNRESIFVALPILLVQLFAGFSFALFQGVLGDEAHWFYHIATIAAVAVVISLQKQNLSQTPKGYFIGLGCFIVAIILWQLLPANIMLAITGILALLTCFIYAIFVGWQMKISHLRKALKFDNEFSYNLWRVAIRIVVPLGIMLALIGSVQSLLNT